MKELVAIIPDMEIKVTRLTTDNDLLRDDLNSFKRELEETRLRIPELEDKLSYAYTDNENVKRYAEE